MNEESKFTVSETTHDIIEYIYNKPNCLKSQINKDLARDYDSKEHIRRRYTRKTINENINLLLEEKQIIALDSYKRGSKEYPDKFRVSEKTLELYPDIRYKEILRLTQIKEDYELGKLRSEISHEDIRNQALLRNVHFDFKSNIKYYFSNEMYSLLERYIYQLLGRCYYNNPDNWKNINKPEDMDFTLTIKVNWSKDTRIFERFKKRREFCLKEQYLQPFSLMGIKSYDRDKRIEIMKGKDINDHFNKAFSETMLRRENYQTIKQKISQMKPKYLESIDKELQKVKKNSIKVNALKDLRLDVEKEYSSFYKNQINLYWYRDNTVGFISDKSKKKFEFEEHQREFVYWENKKYSNKKIALINEEVEKGIGSVSYNSIQDKTLKFIIRQILLRNVRLSKERNETYKPLEKDLEDRIDRLKKKNN